jgi:hypothetical protein
VSTREHLCGESHRHARFRPLPPCAHPDQGVKTNSGIFDRGHAVVVGRQQHQHAKLSNALRRNGIALLIVLHHSGTKHLTGQLGDHGHDAEADEHRHEAQCKRAGINGGNE